MPIRKHNQLERQMRSLKNPRQEREAVVPNPIVELLSPVRERDQIIAQIILGIQAIFSVRTSPPPAPA